MSDDRDALRWIAALPLVSEFKPPQIKSMHQFMAGWHAYELAVKVARAALEEDQADADQAQATSDPGSR
jgi:hypothetical protein